MTTQKALDAAAQVVAVCDALAELTVDGFDAFAGDLRTQWAVEMGLIRIGEGIHRIPAGLLEQYPGQPWREIIAMRNFAAHQYDNLDPGRVWKTITRDVPSLRLYLLDTVIPGLRASSIG